MRKFQQLKIIIRRINEVVTAAMKHPIIGNKIYIHFIPAKDKR